MDGFIELDEMEGMVFIVLVIIGVGGFSEDIKVFFREEIVMCVVVEEIVVIFEVVWSKFLWVNMLLLIVEVVGFIGGINFVVIVIVGRVELIEGIDVVKFLVNVEGWDRVILVLLKNIIVVLGEVIVEILIGSENVCVSSWGVIKVWVEVVCGDKILVDKDVVVFCEELVEKVIFIVFIVEEFGSLGSVWVFVELGDEVELFLDFFEV